MASLVTRLGDLITAIGADVKALRDKVIPRLLSTPVALTDAATIATNAALGNVFRCTVAGDRTVGAPTNPADGQQIRYEFLASGANRTITFASGAGGFAYSTDLPGPFGTLNTGYIGIVGAVYRSDANRWLIVSWIKGY